MIVTLAVVALYPADAMFGQRTSADDIASVRTSVAPASIRGACLNGDQFNGEWGGVDSAGRLLIEKGAYFTGDALSSIALDALMRIEFEGSVETNADEHILFLNDGSALHGLLQGTDVDAVRFDSVLGQGTSIALDEAAAIRWGRPLPNDPAFALFKSWKGKRRAGQDMLITYGAEPKALPGRLVSLTDDGGTFEFGGKSRRFVMGKTFGIVMAQGLTAAGRPPASCVLSNGTTIAGSLEASPASACHLRTTWGGTVKLSAEELRRIEIRSDRLVYLSTLEPLRVETRGVVHDPWPIQKDQSVSRSPISLDGIVYKHGFGVHSFSELVFELKGGYQTLAGMIGIDDAVRPRGSVVFRVLGDGRPLFESDVLTGIDPAIPVKIDVSQIDVLQLIVDWGEGLDLSDHADWADMRLIRPSGGGDDRT
ncbi:MAG: NPCBM/NEW2 domain-containing protein [Phycisphaerae bacterium]